jgi:hypothetical protein
VRVRSSPRFRGLAALVVAMTLCGAAAAAPQHLKKEHAHKPPVQQSAPPPVHYIHCAMELGEGPCGLDPAMQRLNSDPPHSVRPAPPFEGFDFGPER